LWAGTNPPMASDAAWAAADVLHVAARVLGDRDLRYAADAYARAAREPYRVTPRPTRVGGKLRMVARLLAQAGVIDRDAVSWIVLTTRLMDLATAVAEMREAKQRAAAAAGARAATERILAAVGATPGAEMWALGGESAGLAGGDFPILSTGRRTPSPQQGPSRPSTSRRPRRRGPEPPASRGPAR
jgi:hypothetical protein